MTYRSPENQARNLNAVVLLLKLAAVVLGWLIIIWMVVI